MRKSNTSIRLRDMNPARALAYCAVITKTEWSTMKSGDVDVLWTVFRSYILNGYDDTTIIVPDRIKAVWGRCKTIIDKEVER